MDESVKDTVVELSAGIPGAINVLARVWHHGGDNVFFSVADGLRALNYKGSDIWLAYKDWAREDLETFMLGVFTRDGDMQRVVSAAQ